MAFSPNHKTIFVMRASVVSTIKNCFEYHVVQLHTWKSVQYTDMHVTCHVDAEVLN